MIEVDDVATDPILGPIRLCPDCDEWWPDDAEFYADAGPFCRACVDEQVHRRARQVAAAARRYRRRVRAATS